MRSMTILLFALSVAACATQGIESSAHRWTQFVHVEGQPEPVPAEWVSTPEGKLAHSIKIPNPVPTDSGYRPGMTSKEYFEYLCKTEAGEFIFKTVDNVEGFYFMRPPNRPTDDDLKDRYKLEAPEIERTFQLIKATPDDRAATFVNPPWADYLYVEEPNSTGSKGKTYVQASGYRQSGSPMKVEGIGELRSRYGLIWRGVRRLKDRELAIAGSEWIVVDLRSHEVLAVQRNFAQTGRTRNTPGGIWWLNASDCPNVPTKNIFRTRFYDFVSKSLKPVSGESK